MSEYINNREMRQKTIRDIIRQLHEGKAVDEVKQQFEDAFQGVSASEISEAEGALIAEGLPVSEIQRLCDVHASVFKGSIEQIHQPEDPSMIAGHPVNVLKRENRAIERIIEREILPHLSDLEKKGASKELLDGISRLYSVNIHYQKKENLLFPYMEKYGITAPPKVMWGVDDEIRAEIKEIKALLTDTSFDKEDLKQKIDAMLGKVIEMIFKEENIMIPMLLENLTQEDWKIVAQGSPEIGYIIEQVPLWVPNTREDATGMQHSEAVSGSTTSQTENTAAGTETGIVKLPSGSFNLDELTCMLNVLPFDITFVNKDDMVGYFSEGSDRAFPRTRSIIGRNVSNCHPPSSVHIVEKIVEDFKNGKKDHEDFWIRMGEKYILIRYYAVRSAGGEYLGVLEVTQDIAPIQQIEGEKRLMTNEET